MCGIAGIVSLGTRPVHKAELERMASVIVHRGPDDVGYHVGPGVGLTMRRLSIIDLATGRQPVSNEDGTVWIVFNGEIYNFQELRRGLLARGHRFATATDTETIVHLYEEHGARCVEHLRGMFAFAIWDERERQLLLARDRVGIKPLYYAEVGGRLLFGSELKTILELADVEARLNWRAVSHLFTSLATPQSESVIEGIRKLEPGHVLTAGPGRPPRVGRYWDLDVAPLHGRSEGEIVEGLRETLRESVRLHMVSDVPVGAFLSGGVDSSAVVATMAPFASGPVKTFSIGFPVEEYNELRHARLVAKRFGTEHHELVIEPDVIGTLEDLAWHLDEPFGDPSAIPTYMVAKLAAAHVKVVLSGDGGDEVFAGYDKYRVEAKERAYDRVPRLARRWMGHVARLAPDGMRGRGFLHHYALSGAERYLDASTLFRADDKARLFQPEVLEQFKGYDPAQESLSYLARVRDGHWLSRIQYLDIKHYLPLDILTKVDRMSMAHSLEARVPLLDHKLLEFVAAIPPELKLRHGTAKYVFKQAMRGILPDAILDRPKWGFAVPLGEWFKGGVTSYVRDLLLSDRARQRGIFNPRYVENLLRLAEQGRPRDFQIWTLISFELWCRRFLDQPRPGRAVA